MPKKLHFISIQINVLTEKYYLYIIVVPKAFYCILAKTIHRGDLLTTKPDFTLYDKHSEILKALGHPVRLCIVNDLFRTNGCTVTYIQECIHIPQSTISQHIAKLKSAGIIEGRRQGIEIVYSVVDPFTIKLIKTMSE